MPRPPRNGETAALLAGLPVLAERRLRAVLLALAAFLPLIGINLPATPVSDIKG